VRVKAVRYLFLAMLLLGGQFALLVHVADLDAHAVDSGCEVCLHSVPLDAGLVAEASFLPASITHGQRPAWADAAPSVSPARGFAARGPPHAFSA